MPFVTYRNILKKDYTSPRGPVEVSCTFIYSHSSISFPVSMSMYPMSLISVYTILKDVHIPLYIYMD